LWRKRKRLRHKKDEVELGTWGLRRISHSPRGGGSIEIAGLGAGHQLEVVEKFLLAIPERLRAKARAVCIGD